MSGTHLRQTVSTTIYVAGVEVKPTQVTVSLNSGTQAHSAKIECFMQDTSILEKGAPVTVLVDDERLFTGKLISAKMGQEFLVTIQAYGIRWEMRNSEVELKQTEVTSLSGALKDLFKDTSFAGRYDLGPDVGFGENYTTKEYNGESALRVVENLAGHVGANIYVDDTNRLQIRRSPPSVDTYEATHITEIESGEDSEEQTRVIVQGAGSGSISGLSGPGRAVEKQVSEAGESSDGEENVRSIKDKNIFTQLEANNVASKMGVKLNAKDRQGTLKHVGTTKPRVFDQLAILDIADFVVTNLAEGGYQIQSITHTINTDNGFVTEFTVQKPYADVVDDIPLPSGPVQEAYEQFSADLDDPDPLLPDVADTEVGGE